MRPGRQANAERSRVRAPAGAGAAETIPSSRTSVAPVRTVRVDGSRSRPQRTTRGSAVARSARRGRAKTIAKTTRETREDRFMDEASTSVRGSDYEPGARAAGGSRRDGTGSVGDPHGRRGEVRRRASCLSPGRGLEGGRGPRPHSHGRRLTRQGARKARARGADARPGARLVLPPAHEPRLLADPAPGSKARPPASARGDPSGRRQREPRGVAPRALRPRRPDGRGALQPPRLPAFSSRPLHGRLVVSLHRET